MKNYVKKVTLESETICFRWPLKHNLHNNFKIRLVRMMISRCTRVLDSVTNKANNKTLTKRDLGYCNFTSTQKKKKKKRVGGVKKGSYQVP